MKREAMPKKYAKVAVGGTFDRLHEGHKELLRTAFAAGDLVIIGLTSDQMIQGKILSEIIEPFAIRKKQLTAFLKKNNLLGRSSITQIIDPIGTAISDDTIEAVVVGPQASGDAVAAIKKVKPVITCTAIYSSDGVLLSSTRIRKGRVQRDGVVYATPDKALLLPGFLRKNLRKPLGDRIENPKKLTKVKMPLLVTVGDASFMKLISNHVPPDIVIVDGMIQKKKVLSEDQIKRLTSGTDYRFVRTANLAGTVTTGLVNSIKNAFDRYILSKKRTIIFVQGEEDLAVLPAVYFAPLLSRIIYGQPPLSGGPVKPGMIAITVSEKTKKQIGKILGKFIVGKIS